MCSSEDGEDISDEDDLSDEDTNDCTTKPTLSLAGGFKWNVESEGGASGSGLGCEERSDSSSEEDMETVEVRGLVNVSHFHCLLSYATWFYPL